MMLRRSVVHLVVVSSCLVLLVACNLKSKNSDKPDAFQLPYSLTEPETFALTDELHEISGISPLPDSTGLLAINDETGKLFWLDFEGRIIKSKFFHKSGDYEDLAVVGKGVFILKSNGNLLHIPDFSVDSLQTVSYKADLKKDEVEFESLTFDQSNNRLLLLVKDGESVKSKAPFYGFNLAEMKYAPDHVLLLEPRAARSVEAKGRSYRSSAMAFHPITGELYVVASINKMLLVCDRDGNGLGAEKLSKKLFPQPEGLCFLPNGDLFISTEGKSKQAKLMRFRYMPVAAGGQKAAE